MEAAVALPDIWADNLQEGFAGAPRFGTLTGGPFLFQGFGIIDTPGDHDFFNVVLQPGVTYRITLESDPNFISVDGLLRLASTPTAVVPIEGVTVLVDNGSGVGTGDYIVFTPTLSDSMGGNFYLDVSSATADGTGAFDLNLAVLNPFQGAADTTFAFMGGSLELPSSSSPNLSQFAQLQFTTGQQVGVLSPTIYMYEALGLALSEISPALQGILSPGNASDADFVSFIYPLVFGVQPSAAQAQHFLGQLDFYETIYLASGAFGQDITRIETLARGATIGQMLGVKTQDAINSTTPPIINALTATSNLMNESGIATVGTSAAMDFDLL